MKRTLFLLLLGAVLGAAGWQLYRRTVPPPVAPRTGEAGSHGRASAGETKGQALASARTVGGQVGDAGIVVLIKGKYLLDRDLSVLTIGVACTGGHVTLTGTVGSPELVARAATVARQTTGVTGVTALLTVKE